MPQSSPKALPTSTFPSKPKPCFPSELLQKQRQSPQSKEGAARRRGASEPRISSQLDTELLRMNEMIEQQVRMKLGRDSLTESSGNSHCSARSGIDFSISKRYVQGHRETTDYNAFGDSDDRRKPCVHFRRHSRVEESSDSQSLESFSIVRKAISETQSSLSRQSQLKNELSELVKQRDSLKKAREDHPTDDSVRLDAETKFVPLPAKPAGLRSNLDRIKFDLARMQRVISKFDQVRESNF